MNNIKGLMISTKHLIVAIFASVLAAYLFSHYKFYIFNPFNVHFNIKPVELPCSNSSLPCTHIIEVLTIELTNEKKQLINIDNIRISNIRILYSITSISSDSFIIDNNNFKTGVSDKTIFGHAIDFYGLSELSPSEKGFVLQLWGEFIDAKNITIKISTREYGDVHAQHSEYFFGFRSFAAKFIGWIVFLSLLSGMFFRSLFEIKKENKA